MEQKTTPRCRAASAEQKTGRWIRETDRRGVARCCREVASQGKVDQGDGFTGRHRKMLQGGGVAG